MIVVDASALVAIGDSEPDALDYLRVLEQADIAVVGVINALETGIVLMGRGRLQTPEDVDNWLARLGVEVDGSSLTSREVLVAYATYGKGRHPARLNLGDCFAYALAKRLDAPLLYKGGDFALTDIRPALQPT